MLLAPLLMPSVGRESEWPTSGCYALPSLPLRLRGASGVGAGVSAPGTGAGGLIVCRDTSPVLARTPWLQWQGYQSQRE